MPTTTKMGIVYPSSTDLVKDGATAMGTISTTVDAKTGLVLINTTNFSAVSSVSAPNNTFTSNFTHYKTILEITTASTGDYVAARYRASGSDISTSAYQSSFMTIRMAASTSAVDSSGANQSSFSRLGYKQPSVPSYIENTWFSPNLAVTKGFVGTGMFSQADAGEHIIMGGNFDNATVADSITFFPTSGTFTGTLYVYGINK